MAFDRRMLPIVLAVAALAALFGWPSRHGEFLHGDDFGLIRDHYLVNHPSLGHAVRVLFMVHGDLYQPVPVLTFMANYALGGAETYGYHLVNIGLHAVCAALAALLAARLASDRRVGLLAGAMFACHPFAMESVAWVTGRIILLAALFGLLLMLLFAARPERPTRGWSIGAIVAWVLSLASKVMPGVPLAAVFCDWCMGRTPVSRGGPRSRGKEPRGTGFQPVGSDTRSDAHPNARTGKMPVPPNRCWWFTVAALLLLTAVFTGFAYYSTQRLDYFRLMSAESTTPLPVRMLIASGYYFRNYLLPTRLSAWSPPPVGAGWTDPRTLFGAAGWLALGAAMLAARRRCPTVFAGIGLFVLLIAPFLAAMAARSFLTADRYMYLPIFGLHLAVAGAAVAACDALGRRVASRAAAAGLLILAAVGVFSAWTVQGARVATYFHSTLTQGRHTVDLYPGDVRAWVALARAHIQSEDPAGALDVVAKAREHWPDDAGLAAEAGEACWMLKRFEYAAREFEVALAGRPRNDQAKYYLGLSLAALGERDRPRQLWKEILADKTHFLPAATALARSYRDAGDDASALDWFRKAIELNAHHRDARFEAALLEMKRGDWAAGAEQLRYIAEELDPQDAPARLNLAVCLSRLGRPEEALAIYAALRAEGPRQPLLEKNRAQLLASLPDRRTEAEAALRDILRDEPGDRDAALGLNELLQSQGRYGDLVKLWSDVLKSPNPPEDAGGWLELSRAMAGDAAAAATTQSAATEDVLAAWTPVWRELVRAPRDDAALAAALDHADLARVKAPGERDRLRIIVAGLSDYGRMHSKDPAAICVLALALYASGNQELADRVAAEAYRLDTDGYWGKRAGQFRRNSESEPRP